MTPLDLAPVPVGLLLREWRAARRLSQLDLSLDANISARHLSCIETGKSQPSRTLLMRLADVLDMPLRERNALLRAGGYAPSYPESALDTPAMGRINKAIAFILEQQEPYPAFLMNRHWDILAANQAAQDQYAADSAGYESLRARYAAERAAYHRHVWPDHYTVWSPRRDARLIDTRVELWDGARVGHIDAVARNRSTGDLEAVRVRMDDSGRQVWIDSADLRFDAGHNVVATNLDHADLIRMSQEG